MKIAILDDYFDTLRHLPCFQKLAGPGRTAPRGVNTVNRKGFHAFVHPGKPGEFEISGNDPGAMIALLLRRRREASGASLRDVASRLGASSRNAYARCERGEAVPSLDKLDALLKAAAPGHDFVIRAAADTTS